MRVFSSGAAVVSTTILAPLLQVFYKRIFRAVFKDVGFYQLLWLDKADFFCYIMAITLNNSYGYFSIRVFGL